MEGPKLIDTEGCYILNRAEREVIKISLMSQKFQTLFQNTTE